MKYVVEWTITGEITIDTGDTSWTPEQLNDTLDSTFSEAASKVGETVEENFEDCEVDGNAGVEYQQRRIT